MAKTLGGGGRKKSGGSPIFTILLVIMALAVLGSGGFLVYQRVLAPQNNVVEDPTQDPNFVQTINVAVVQESVKVGDPITDENVAFMDIRADSTYPENTVFSGGVELDGSCVFALDIEPNTVLTNSMVWDPELDEVLDDTSRVVAVSGLTNSNKLEEGDYIDIRFRTTSTKDNLSYADEVVLAKKRVVDVSGSKVTLNLTEEEQVILNVAQVDMAYTNSNSKDLGNIKATLYTTLYANPSQEAAIASYTNPEIEEQIKVNPNLIQQVQDALENGTSVDFSNGETVDIDQSAADPNQVTDPNQVVDPSQAGADGSVDGGVSTGETVAP